MTSETTPPTDDPDRDPREEAGGGTAAEDEAVDIDDPPVGAAAFSEGQLQEAREAAGEEGEPIRPERNGPVDQLARDSPAYAEAQGDHRAAELLAEEISESQDAAT